jgi:hypothetical protein
MLITRRWYIRKFGSQGIVKENKMKAQFEDAPTTQLRTFVADCHQWRAVKERALHLGVSASQFLRDALAERLRRTSKERK